MSEEQKPKEKQRLGDLLIRANLIDDIQLRVALKAQKDTGERLGTTLVELGFIDEAVLAAFLSKQADMPCINIANIRIPREIVTLIPKEMAQAHAVMPIRRAGDVLYLAMSNPFDHDTLKLVEAQLPDGLHITPMIAPEVSLKKALERHYEPEKLAVTEQTAELLGVIDELELDSLKAVVTKIDELKGQIDQLLQLTGKVDELTQAVNEIRAALVRDQSETDKSETDKSETDTSETDKN